MKVTATINPAEGATSQQVTVSVDLSPGDAQAVQLTGLRLAPSTPTTLTIGAVEPGGEPGTAYKSVTVEVPGPNFAGVTTSTSTTASNSTTTTT